VLHGFYSPPVLVTPWLSFLLVEHGGEREVRQPHYRSVLPQKLLVDEVSGWRLRFLAAPTALFHFAHRTLLYATSCMPRTGIAFSG